MSDASRSRLEKRHWRLKITSLPTHEDEAPGELTCGPGVCGWLAQALELTGVKAPRLTHTRCRFHGGIATRTHGAERVS